MNEREVIKVFLNPEPIYPSASFLIWKFSVLTKVLKNQVLKADLPHNRPFPRHWCNKKRYLYFSQKSDSNQNLDFNPVPPHICKYFEPAFEYLHLKSFVPSQDEVKLQLYEIWTLMILSLAQLAHFRRQS